MFNVPWVDKSPRVGCVFLMKKTWTALLTCLLAGCAATNVIVDAPSKGDPLDSDAFELSTAAVAKLQKHLEEESSTCESRMVGGKIVVRYIGSTDEPLLKCALQYASLETAKWIITSGGGVSDFAIPVAYLFAARNWEIVVIGHCTSSCANYLVPAAKSVSVEKYSVLLLHGSPHTYEEVINPDAANTVCQEVAKWHPNETPQQIEVRCRDARDALRSTIAIHDDFAHAMQIGNAWFDFDPRTGSLELFHNGAENGYVMADRELYESCVAGPSDDAYWQPVTEADWNAIGRLIPSKKLYRRRIREKFLCR